MAQVLEDLASKGKALSSNPSNAKKRKIKWNKSSISKITKNPGLGKQKVAHRALFCWEDSQIFHQFLSFLCHCLTHIL
jgi:hypothetical protein